MTVSVSVMTRLSFIRGFARLCEISRHLQPFYLKRGVRQLTDHKYNMSMPIFCNYLVTVLLINC
jgi:hypothetical protein